MAKLNPIPPTLREKYRYLVVEIVEPKDVEFELSEIVNAVWESALELYGSVGASTLHLWVPSNLYIKEKKRFVVRCGRKRVEETRLAITSIKEVSRTKVVLRVVGVSGTIKSARTKYL